jgi:hypothetical protein
MLQLTVRMARGFKIPTLPQERGKDGAAAVPYCLARRAGSSTAPSLALRLRLIA